MRPIAQESIQSQSLWAVDANQNKSLANQTRTMSFIGSVVQPQAVDAALIPLALPAPIRAATANLYVFAVLMELAANLGIVADGSPLQRLGRRRSRRP